MRMQKHWRSAALFCAVTAAFVAAGSLMGGGSLRSSGKSVNTDQRTVLVETLLIERSGDSGSDPVFDDLLGVVHPAGGGRLLTAAEFDKARGIASTLSAGPGVLRMPALVAQHNETSRTTLVRASGTASLRITPSVLEECVVRVSMTISQDSGGESSETDLVFTSRGGAALATETLALGGSGSVSSILLVRPTLVVDER